MTAPSSWRRQLGGTLRVQIEHLQAHVAEGGSFLTTARQVLSRSSNLERGQSRGVLMGLTMARRAAVLERRGRYFSRAASEWAAELGVPEHAVIQFRKDFADRLVPGVPRRRA